MDRNTAKQLEIERLIRASSAARGQIGDGIASIRHQLDLPARVKESLRDHPARWIAGSMLSGVAARFVFRRRKHHDKGKRRGIPAALLGMAVSAATPFAKFWLADQLRNWSRPYPGPAKPDDHRRSFP